MAAECDHVTLVTLHHKLLMHCAVKILMSVTRTVVERAGSSELVHNKRQPLAHQNV